MVSGYRWKLSKYAIYVRELQRAPAKGHDTSGKQKNPTHFLFLLWQQLFSLSRNFLHLTFIIARCSVPSGKRRAWMLFLLLLLLLLLLLFLLLLRSLLLLLLLFNMIFGSMDKTWL